MTLYNIPQRIVAEVSKTWVVKDRLQMEASEVRTISFEFETICETNRKRGYDLEDWWMSSVLSADGSLLIETIVAIFEKDAEDE